MAAMAAMAAPALIQAAPGILQAAPPVIQATGQVVSQWAKIYTIFWVFIILVTIGACIFLLYASKCKKTGKKANKDNKGKKGKSGKSWMGKGNKNKATSVDGKGICRKKNSKNARKSGADPANPSSWNFF